MESKQPELPSYIRVDNDGLIISIKVQPRASKNAIGTPLGNELRIKVIAPPVDAVANDALLRFLEEMLDVPRNRLVLLRGHSSRHKQIRIFGMALGKVLSRIVAG